MILEKEIHLEYFKNKKTEKNLSLFSERDRIRTCDRLLRRQMLYPAELRTHNNFEKIIKTLKIAILTFYCSDRNRNAL